VTEETKKVEAPALLTYDHIDVTVHFTVWAQSVGECNEVIEKVARLLALENGVTVEKIEQLVSNE